MGIIKSSPPPRQYLMMPLLKIEHFSHYTAWPLLGGDIVPSKDIG